MRAASALIVVFYLLQGSLGYQTGSNAHPGSDGAQNFPPVASNPVPAMTAGGNPMSPPVDGTATPPMSPETSSGAIGPSSTVPNLHMVITDPSGRPVPSMNASKVAREGRKRHILLEDINLIHQLAHFDRERIPDRVAHAKGAGAHGYFEVTHDITRYTKASIFAHVGKRTPVFTRFSSTLFESGSADTLNDRRGFAVKFYTDEGNWDLVGTNIEVFPICDPIKTGVLLHAVRRNPRTGLQDFNQTWDFLSLNPESTHFMLQVLSPIGFPRNFRHMNGGGVNTFKLVNAAGEVFFVKFLWRTNQGVQNLTIEESFKLAGVKPDVYREDLFRSIEAGNFPSWNLSIQVLTPVEALAYRWNPFDATKLILETDFPPIPVGRMVLNKNPTDFFTEVELFAACPGNLVPGIEVSPDILLQGRTFSYLDTQRYRLGVNFMQLPINRPRVPVRTFDRDGKCAIENGQGHPNYFPNSVDGSFVSPRGKETEFHIDADVVREDLCVDHFSQPKIFWDSLSPADKEQTIKLLALSLVGVSPNIKERVLENFGKVDPRIAVATRKTIAVLEAQQAGAQRK